MTTTTLDIPQSALQRSTAGIGKVPRAAKSDRSELTRERLLKFGGVIVGGILLAVLAAFWTSKTQQSDQDQLHTSALGLLAVEQSISDGEAIRAGVFGISIARQASSPELIEQFSTATEEAFVSLSGHLDEAYVGLADSAEAQAVVLALQDTAAEFEELTATFMENGKPISQMTPEEMVAISEQFDTWSLMYEAIRAEQERASDLGEALLVHEQTSADSGASRMQVLIALTALIAIGVFAYLGRKVLAAVVEMRRMQHEMARVTSMMENAPTNMMFTDNDMVVRYVNPAAQQTLRKLEQYLPCKADDVVGNSVDVFHANPAHQRAILTNPDRHLPMTTNIELGPETLELIISSIKDASGQHIGAMASWVVVTEQLRMTRDAAEAHEREREQAADLQAKVDSMLEVLAAAAQGDLTREVTVDGDDAVGRMGRALSKLLGDLRGSVSGIASNSEALAAAAEELQVVSVQMGANASETSNQVNLISEASVEVSRSVETVSTGAEEMSASIKEIAKNASDAAKVATQAVEAATLTNLTVSKLGESSAEIGEIVKVITGIAQQTNLLALNATIEAARAGEAGKGFAVVANEVKELAKETARATEDISAKIEAIQADTQSSVEAITGILGTINQIAEFQDTIASAVEQQAATTSEIARSVTDASRGSTEITANMQSVASAADSTSTGAGDSQRAASELARMAADLQDLIAQFTY
ncbi:MAG: methyl-accepting chemotaxis protein [Acidimicrobiia bacterium]